MNKLLLFFVTLGLFCAALCVSFEANVSAKNSYDLKLGAAKSGLKDDELKIFALINNERERKRLNDMSWNDDLADAARNYSRKMAKGNFFSHYDGDGKSVSDRVSAAKVKSWRKIGENLFFCQGIEKFDEFAVKNWMKSADHKQNILDRDWTDSGIGIAESKEGKIYITQIFMKR